MFRSCEYANEPPEDQVEADLSVFGRKIRDGWLVPHDECQFRNEVRYESSVRIQRPTEVVSPLAELLFALPQKGTGQSLKGLRQSCVRDVALGLVEFPCCEKAARRNQRFVELINHGRLADSGIPGDQHQFRPASGDDTVKGGEQGLDLVCAPVQFLRN